MNEYASHIWLLYRLVIYDLSVVTNIQDLTKTVMKIKVDIESH